MRSRAAVLWNKMVDGLTVKKILLILLGAMICSFGIHNIHQRTNITEGGVIGLMPVSYTHLTLPTTSRV